MMTLKKALISLNLGLIGCLGFLYYDPIQPPEIVPESINPIENAYNATGGITLIDQEISGSFFLISKVKREDGLYLYRGITAYHVLESALQPPFPTLVEIRTLLYFARWHGDNIELKTNIALKYLVPALDWAAFEFSAKENLPCLPPPQRGLFEKMSPTDTIYVIGNDAVRNIIIRQCSIAATSNMAPEHRILEQRQSIYPHNFSPENAFRFASFVHGGASGGVVIDDAGRIIGVIVAYSIPNSTCPGVALKMDSILNTVLDYDSLFLSKD